QSGAKPPKRQLNTPTDKDKATSSKKVNLSDNNITEALGITSTLLQTESIFTTLVDSDPLIQQQPNSPTLNTIMAPDPVTSQINTINQTLLNITNRLTKVETATIDIRAEATANLEQMREYVTKQIELQQEQIDKNTKELTALRQDTLVLVSKLSEHLANFNTIHKAQSEHNVKVDQILEKLTDKVNSIPATAHKDKTEQPAPLWPALPTAGPRRIPTVVSSLQALKNNQELTPEQTAILTFGTRASIRPPLELNNPQPIYFRIGPYKKDETPTQRKNRIIESFKVGFGVGTGILAVSLLGRSVGHALVNEPQATELIKGLKKWNAYLENYNPLAATPNVSTEKVREYTVARIGHLIANTINQDKITALCKGCPEDLVSDIKAYAQELRTKSQAYYNDLWDFVRTPTPQDKGKGLAIATETNKPSAKPTESIETNKESTTDMEEVQQQ
ncbi:hypothetical protein HDU76_009316, partial [Blyttiomyces sp. JEL0837]